MIIYKAAKSDFMCDVGNHQIADILERSIREKMNRATPPNEKRSWMSSLMEMKNVLENQDIPSDCGVAVEYNIPLSGNRIDVVLSGYDAFDKAYMVVIELKQWQSVEAVPGSDGIVRTYVSGRIREKTHPSYQAWSYAIMMASYNEFVQDKPVHMSPCAYLHNYGKQAENDPLFRPQYDECLNAAPSFTKDDVAKLQSFICKYIVKGDRKCNLIIDVDRGKIRPAKSLQDSIAGMIRGNREFNLIESQKVAYDKILIEARSAQKDAKKHVVIVKGGPGTGKSVIAITAMARLTQAPDSQFVQYISKNSAPRNVYKLMLKGTKRKKDVDLMFQGPDSFYLRPENMLATVLVDEAHRLRMRSGQFCNKGESQIREIMRAAKCSVFFVDDHQRVTIKDSCTVDAIKEETARIGVVPVEIELDSQFRCNGSDGYVGWLDNVLGIRQTANTSLEGVNYDFKIFDDPQAMFDAIVQKNVHNKARVVAGYCWDWQSDKKSDPTYCDIRIGHFEKSWNLGNTDTWAIDAASVNQVGCIHTCQGLEFEYVGVIIGPDLRYENGHIVTDWRSRASTDSSIKGAKGIVGLSTLSGTNPLKAEAIGREIILNTYRTLMTRGMKGCYVYCCDRMLAAHLAEMICSRENATIDDRGMRQIIVPHVIDGAEIDSNLLFVKFLPVYSMAVACGPLTDGQEVESIGWMKAEGHGKLDNTHFIVKTEGMSMIGLIDEGAYVILRKLGGGDLEGKTVLVQRNDMSDPESGGAYTIKTFMRKDGKVILKARNPQFEDIVLDDAEHSTMYRVIAEYKCVIRPV